MNALEKAQRNLELNFQKAAMDSRFGGPVNGIGQARDLEGDHFIVWLSRLPKSSETPSLPSKYEGFRLVYDYLGDVSAYKPKP